MNIKEHIEAGHYPKDEKGRALVPTRSGAAAIIYATDHGEGYPIIGRGPIGSALGGWTWDEDGCLQSEGRSDADLLPPPPRKVKVTMRLRGGNPLRLSDWRVTNLQGGDQLPIGAIVELTGEYEEPWA